MNSRSMRSLNLGSGPDRLNGFVNYDMLPVGDVCGNCEEGLPFKDNTFDQVKASHILEHIHNLRGLKCELHRVMKPDGELVVVVPDYQSPDAWGDDTHCRAFSNQSFFLDFWPGFKVISLKGQEMMKTVTKEKVMWLIATIRKESDETRVSERMLKAVP